MVTEYLLCFNFFPSVILETCSLISQILAFSLRLKVGNYIFWWTIDHGWENLVHTQHTCGNWWLPRLRRLGIPFQKILIFKFFLNHLWLMSFSHSLSLGYLLLQTQRLGGGERSERMLLLSPIPVNQQSLRDGSCWLKWQLCPGRGVCLPWRN
jgi:hypothetical protein